MSVFSEFKFNNTTRIGSEMANLSQRSIQDVNAGNYLLTNYYSHDCNMTQGMSVALSEPSINFKGAHQLAGGGCNVDTNSELLLGKIQTNPRGRVQLTERLFATVPYLGKGKINPDVETELMTGDMITNKKSITNLSEKSYIPLSHPELIPDLANTISNPKHLVEDVAVDGWIRGGLPSRELTKEHSVNILK